MRNKVFFKSKKYKFEKTIILKDDMIKTDHASWSKAKPQMNAAHTDGKRMKYKFSKLKIDNEFVKIDGVLSKDEILEKAKVESTLVIVKKNVQFFRG